MLKLCSAGAQIVLGWCSNCARLVLKLCSAGAQIVLGWCSNCARLGAQIVLGWCSNCARLVLELCSAGARIVLGWCSNCARLVLKLCSAGAQIVLGCLEAPNVCFGRRFYKQRRSPRLFFERALWREKRAHCCENVRFVMQMTPFLHSTPPKSKPCHSQQNVSKARRWIL